MIQLGKPGGQSRNGFVPFQLAAHGVHVLANGVTQLLWSVAVVLCGEAQHLLLHHAQNLPGTLTISPAGQRGNFVAAFRHLPQHRLVRHNFCMPFHIGCRNGQFPQKGHIIYAAHIVQLVPAFQFFNHSDQIHRLLLSVQRQHNLVNNPVGGAVKIFRLQNLRYLVDHLCTDQHRAEHILLRRNILRNLAFLHFISSFKILVIYSFSAAPAVRSHHHPHFHWRQLPPPHAAGASFLSNFFILSTAVPAAPAHLFSHLHLHLRSRSHLHSRPHAASASCLFSSATSVSAAPPA